MSSRPTPRKSGLAGKSPVTPPAQQPLGKSVPAEREDAGVTPPKTETPAKEPAKKKVSFYQDETRTAHARGAHLYTMAHERRKSLSEFIDNAVMAEVERLEAKYNDGKPFPPVQSGEIPQGRPMGE